MSLCLCMEHIVLEAYTKQVIVVASELEECTDVKYGGKETLFMMLSQMLCHEHELQKSNFKNHYCEIYHTLQHCHLFPRLSDLPISTPNTHTHKEISIL